MSKSKMPTITPDDTATIFIDSGALEEYPWYVELESHGVGDAGTNTDDDWTVTFTPYDPISDEKSERVTLNHAKIMTAVRTIARGDAKGLNPNGPVRKECQTLLFKGPDQTDFDAPMADCVLQFATYGDVIYG
jgi:hypothetical protein